MSIKPLKASQRMRNVQPPIISIISDLIKKNPDTISLGQGVVYYGPPEIVFEKISTLNYSAEHHVYSEVEGILADILISKAVAPDEMYFILNLPDVYTINMPNSSLFYLSKLLGIFYFQLQIIYFQEIYHNPFYSYKNALIF